MYAGSEILSNGADISMHTLSLSAGHSFQIPCDFKLSAFLSANMYHQFISNKSFFSRLSVTSSSERHGTD